MYERPNYYSWRCRRKILPFQMYDSCTLPGNFAENMKDMFDLLDFFPSFRHLDVHLGYVKNYISNNIYDSRHTELAKPKRVQYYTLKSTTW